MATEKNCALQLSTSDTIYYPKETCFFHLEINRPRWLSCRFSSASKDMVFSYLVWGRGAQLKPVLRFELRIACLTHQFY